MAHPNRSGMKCFLWIRQIKQLYSLPFPDLSWAVGILHVESGRESTWRMGLKLSQPFRSLSMIFDRFQPPLLSAQHRSTVKFAFLCLLHYSHYQGLCSARTIWQFCSGKRDPMLLLHWHSNVNRSKILVLSLKWLVVTHWMCWEKICWNRGNRLGGFTLGAAVFQSRNLACCTDAPIYSSVGPCPHTGEEKDP